MNKKEFLARDYYDPNTRTYCFKEDGSGIIPEECKIEMDSKSIAGRLSILKLFEIKHKFGIK